MRFPSICGLVAVLKISAVDALALPLQRVSLVVRDSATPPIVTIKNGSLSGRYEPRFSQDFFFNIPYAQPPIGDLRLADPQPYATAWSASRNASQWGNMCPGSGSSSTKSGYNEDCLNINIVRPAGTKKGDNLPVLFFIFGGGFTAGAVNSPRYNSSYLVQQSVENGEPIVFASINYRLSAFGFPANPISPLNLGLKDQRLSLHWVQENIGEFGGDPAKVTLWGQSAGGISVASQMAAYGGRDEGLFRASCIDSGVFAGSVYSNASIASQAPAWLDFLDTAGCNTDEQLSCLRALPYKTFHNAAISTSYDAYPVPDGDFMRENALVSFANQRVVAVPLLIGATKDEATSGLKAPVGLNNDTAVRAAVNTLFATVSPGNETIDKLLELYPNDNAVGCPFDTGDRPVSTGLQDKRTNAIVTDQIHAGARKAAKEMSTKVPVWSWRFNQVPQNNTIDQGVAHGSELAYLFGVQGDRLLGNRPGVLALSKTMQNYWLSFVNHLDPNASPSVSNATKWEKYDDSMSNMVFLNEGSVMAKDDYRKDGIDYITKVGLGEV